VADAASVSDASDDLPPLTSAELQPKHPHRLIAIVVDHLHRDPTRLRLRECGAVCHRRRWVPPSTRAARRSSGTSAPSCANASATAPCQHPQLLAIAPKHLPVAACRAVVNSLIKSRLLIEVAAPRDQLAMVWRKDGDGTPILIQVTDEGLRAIGIDPNEGRVAPDTAPQGGESETPQQDDAVKTEPAQAAPEAPNMASVNLREAAERLLAAWEETPPANTTQDPITRAMDMLRKVLSRRGTRATGAPRKPREGTKQEVVLAMLRRPEGATVAQIAEATGWAQHTVRGFFAGLKKRQGITVEIAERIRQVGPNKQGAKGSYTIYRVAE